MKKTKQIITAIILAIAGAFIGLHGYLFSQRTNYTPSEKDLPIDTLTELQTAFPKAAFVELTAEATFAVKNDNGKVIGTVLLSSPYSDNIKGFNGPTPL